MTVVGVISDTHGRLSLAAYEALAGCDHLIHAGDICDADILRELETLAPVTAVLGNNDYAEYGSHVGRFAKPVIAGVRFLVAHYPHDVEIGAFGRTPLAPGEAVPDVCIHGHTHLPRLDYGKDARPASYIVNPGSATLPRGGNPASIAKIAIDGGAVRAIRIESLNGEVIRQVGTCGVYF